MSKSRLNRRACLSLLAIPILHAAGSPARAQPDAAAYPARAIRVVVPYSPGGNTDIIARAVMTGLSERLGQSIVIDNKPGANSILGTDLVAKSQPDGHTLLVVIGAYANNQSLYKRLPFSPGDLAPVSLLSRTSLVAVTGQPDIKRFDDLKRARPGGPLSFASSGLGSAAHVLSERVVRSLGVQAIHVPYKGSTDAINDLVSGRVDFMFDAVSAMGPLIQQGRLTALAVTGESRTPQLPQAPSLSELGHPELVSYVWAGLLAPGKTPKPIIAKLAAELDKVLREPALKAKLADISTEAMGGTPDDLAAFIANEVKVNGEVIKQLGLSLD
jgi:tripartite-type tricarboxylate transporter receptor subunit TctC